MSQPHVWNRVEGFVWGSEYRPLGEVVVDLPVPQYFPRKERRSNGGAKQSRSFYLVLHCEDFVKKEPQWEGRTWRTSGIQDHRLQQVEEAEVDMKPELHAVAI